MVKHSNVNDMALCNTVAKKNPLEFAETEADVTCKKCLKILAKKKKDEVVIEDEVAEDEVAEDEVAEDEVAEDEDEVDDEVAEDEVDDEVVEDEDPSSNPQWTM